MDTCLSLSEVVPGVCTPGHFLAVPAQDWANSCGFRKKPEAENRRDWLALVADGNNHLEPTTSAATEIRGTQERWRGQRISHR